MPTASIITFIMLFVALFSGDWHWWLVCGVFGIVEALYTINNTIKNK